LPPGSVALVASVVVRKNTVRPPSRLFAIIPNRTTNPEMVIAGLIATCSIVKGESWDEHPSDSDRWGSRPGKWPGPI
jgi:hypothetical protein